MRGSARGSGRVAVLYKEEHNEMHNDVDVGYTWLWIQRREHNELYCNLPRLLLMHNFHLYLLVCNIVRFTNMGDIMLLGKFTACSKDEQTSFDTSETMYGNFVAIEVGLE